MKRTYTKLFIALLTALLLAAGCGSDDEDDTPAAEYKVLGGRLVWCSGGAEDMVVPATASSIGNNAFGNCGAIGTLTIPTSVTHIMRYTFSGVRVGKIIFGGTVGEWAAMAEQDGFGETLDGTPVICSDGEWRWIRPAVPEQPAEPDEPWEIEDGVVVKYTGSATNETIPSNVTAIAGGAFEGHTELERVVIPAGVTAIAPGAFAGSGITEIEYKGGLSAWEELVEAGGIADELDGITVTCDGEVWTPAHTHTWGETYTDDGTGGHYRTCTGCGGHSATEAHTWGGAPQADGDGGHCQTCTGCGAHSPTVAHDYAYSDDSSTTHTMTCTGCNYTKTEAHAYGGEAYTDAGHVKTCAGCKHSETAQHTWGDTYENGDNGHYLTCTTAGCNAHSPAETHQYGTTYTNDNNGKHHQTCSVCHGQSEAVTHTVRYSNSNGSTHTKTCAANCGYSATEAHTWGSETCTETGHTKTCTLCTYSASKPHDWGDYTSDGTDTHSRTCAVEGFEAHTDRKTHDYGTTYADDKNGKHSQTCSVCAATKTASHTYGTTYTSAGTTGHYQTCTACDARSATKPHDCSYSGIDADNHEERCKTCTYSATVAHTYAYTRTDAVHHSGVCAGCNARVEGDRHVYSGDSCRNCGSPKPVLEGATIVTAHAKWEKVAFSLGI